MLVSLATVYQGRLFKKGVADPRLTKVILEAWRHISENSKSQFDANWARSLLNYTMSDFGSGEVNSNIRLVEPNSYVIKFDESLNHFLEAVKVDVDG